MNTKRELFETADACCDNIRKCYEQYLISSKALCPDQRGNEASLHVFLVVHRIEIAKQLTTQRLELNQSFAGTVYDIFQGFFDRREDRGRCAEDAVGHRTSSRHSRQEDDTHEGKMR